MRLMQSPQFLTARIVLGILTLLEIHHQSSHIFVNSERILFFNGFASHSHLVAMEPLARKLADRGHNVTMLTPMVPEKPHPAITITCPKDVAEMQGQLSDLGSVGLLMRLESRYNDLFMQHDVGFEGAFMVCQAFYKSAEFQSWIKANSFDLIVIDAWTRECAMPLAHIWKAKFILFSVLTFLPAEQDTLGFSPESAWQFSFESSWKFIPDSWIYEYKSIVWYFWRQYKFIPRFDQLLREEMKDWSFPALAEMEKQAALYIINTHFAADLARALPPHVISVGGMHCKEATEIKDKKIRDAVEDPNFEGFIYISFGSFVQISALPPQFLVAFIETIKSFPKFKFLWRWDGAREVPESLKALKNVFIHSWFPQQDILGHPKCRGFISQGGLMSFQQAIFHAVPQIIMPIWGDQTLNSKLAAKFGTGIPLEFSDATPESLKGAVDQLVNNPMYKNNAKQISKYWRDRPMSAVDTAVWWTEYALRHENLDHLKSPGIHLHWWQRRFYHVLAIVGIIILAILKLFCLSLSLLLKIVRGNSSKSDSDTIRKKKK